MPVCYTGPSSTLSQAEQRTVAQLRRVVAAEMVAAGWVATAKKFEDVLRRKVCQRMRRV